MVLAAKVERTGRIIPQKYPGPVYGTAAWREGWASEVRVPKIGQTAVITASPKTPNITVYIVYSK